MKNVALALLLAGTAAFVAGCNRTDPATGYPSNSTTGPVSAPTTATTPPPLPAAPSTPTGVGSAQPATSPAAPVAAGGAPATGSGTPDGKASDTAANAPTGTLTKQQESNEMPKAGQVNNHSSTAMEESRGQK